MSILGTYDVLKGTMSRDLHPSTNPYGLLIDMLSIFKYRTIWIHFAEIFLSKV